MSGGPDVFRKVALDRLSSPDELDEAGHPALHGV